MKRLTRFALASLSLASLALALPALAQDGAAYVTGNVNMRAGPDPSYPLIDQLPAGTGISVQGCTNGWEWCDVIAQDNNRGWVAGNFIGYQYQDQPVLLPEYGAQIGIPIVSFVIGAYWDNYYRGRPFYNDRDNWYRRRIDVRPPPPIRQPYRYSGPVRNGGEPGYPTYHPTMPGHLGPVSPGRPMQPMENGRPAENGRPQQYGNHSPAPAPNHAPPARPGNEKTPPPRKDDHDNH
ncbi:SH3 domain-containing protein [Rhodanobacter sp. C05]|uniref:SH3 domain-containing protein n=1 Tax=Rhodanobacter sp. C05 TaxID=1945855 RepID=UPI001439C06D|nr:SH3 domain-containing protein [Rhodanobacter sp. C05]